MKTFRTAALPQLTACLLVLLHDQRCAVRELAPPGDLPNAVSFPFEFRNVEMMYDSYRGQAVRCR